jgi:hypothetical protein
MGMPPSDGMGVYTDGVGRTQGKRNGLVDLRQAFRSMDRTGYTQINHEDLKKLLHHENIKVGDEEKRTAEDEARRAVERANKAKGVRTFSLTTVLLNSRDGQGRLRLFRLLCTSE